MQLQFDLDSKNIALNSIGLFVSTLFRVGHPFEKSFFFLHVYIFYFSDLYLRANI